MKGAPFQFLKAAIVCLVTFMCLCARTQDASWDDKIGPPGINGYSVGAIAISGREVFVGGGFTHAGDLPVNHIACWDGTNWSALGEGISGGGPAVLAVAGTNLYVGGEFRQAGSVITYDIAMWNGQTWQDVGGGVTTSESMPARGVQALAVSGNTLYAGGGFLRIGGVDARTIAKWDGTSWSPLGSGIYVNGGILDLACSGAELYVGGGFDAIGGKASTNIALWHIPPELAIRREGDAAVVSWPSTGTNFVLESKGDTAATNWSEVYPKPAVVAADCVVTNALDAPERIYRLRR